jgi:hypothetical protein
VPEQCSFLLGTGDGDPKILVLCNPGCGLGDGPIQDSLDLDIRQGLGLNAADIRWICIRR